MENMMKERRERDRAETCTIRCGGMDQRDENFLYGMIPREGTASVLCCTKHTCGYA